MEDLSYDGMELRESRGMMLKCAKSSAPKKSAGWSFPSISLPSFGGSKAAAPDDSMRRSIAKPKSRGLPA